MEQALTFTIQQSLSNYLTDNAVFLAERMLAQFPGDNAVCLVADCYLQQGSYQKAFSFLETHKSNAFSEAFRYKYAMCAYKLGKHALAETILKSGPVPNGAFGYYLLGVVAKYV